MKSKGGIYRLNFIECDNNAKFCKNNNKNK